MGRLILKKSSLVSICQVSCVPCVSCVSYVCCVSYVFWVPCISCVACVCVCVCVCVSCIPYGSYVARVSCVYCVTCGSHVSCVSSVSCAWLAVNSLSLSPTPRQQIVQSKKQSVNIELGCNLSQIITLQIKANITKCKPNHQGT